jgi:hypothetical protein
MDNSSGKVSANLQGGRWKKLDVERFSQVTLTPVLMIGHYSRTFKLSSSSLKMEDGPFFAIHSGYNQPES